MTRVRREHRLAGHVGRLRIRLAANIVKVLAEQGLTARCDPADLCPAQGRWRTDHLLDVYRWEGFLLVQNEAGDWRRASIDSWDTMRNCNRNLGIKREGFGFEAYAK